MIDYIGQIRVHELSDIFVEDERILHLLGIGISWREEEGRYALTLPHRTQEIRTGHQEDAHRRVLLLPATQVLFVTTRVWEHFGIAHEFQVLEYPSIQETHRILEHVQQTAVARH